MANIGQGRTITCKFCQLKGLRWDAEYYARAHKWRLINPDKSSSTYGPHRCQEMLDHYANGDSFSRSDLAAPTSTTAQNQDTISVPVGNSGFKVTYNPNKHKDAALVAAMTPTVTPQESEKEEDNEDYLPVVPDNTSPVVLGEPASDDDTFRQLLELRGLIAQANNKRASADLELRDLAADIAEKTTTNLIALNDYLTRKIAELEAKITGSQIIEVKLPTGEIRNVGRQHKTFPELLQYVSLRLHCLLVGPAGGGKTTAGEKVAEALDLRFYLQPMGPDITSSRLLGWIDANGKLVRTLFRDAYESGGIFFADEMDASNPSALTCINGALANGQVGFPDQMISRHPDFVFIGGANTYGRGADRIYVGRAQLDGATLDRFLVVEWDYDEQFELELAGTDQLAWVRYVQRVRRIVFDADIREIVSPRASIDGALMLRNSVPISAVKRTRLFAKMAADSVSQIKQKLGE